MLELMKKQTTPEWGEVCLTVPLKDVDRFATAITHFLLLAGHAVQVGDDEDSALYPGSEVMADSSPCKRLRGLRVREGINQTEMANRLGLRQHHVSDFETGRRPISVEMAKRIGTVFHVSYKVFL